MARSNRRNRRNRSRGDRPGLRTAYSPQQYEAQIHRSGLVFQPSVQMPAQTLAMLQFMFRGGIRGNDSINDAIKRHYGNESLTFEHIGSFLEMFSFGRYVRDTHISVSVIVGFVLTLQSLFGTKGAFRFWNMLFDFILSNCRVDYANGEPVASLHVYKDTSEYDESWDVHFPHYRELVFHTLRNMRNMDEINTYMVHAAQGSDYHKQVAYILAQATDGETFSSRYNVVRPSSGGYVYVEDTAPPQTAPWAVAGVTDGLLGDLLRANRASVGEVRDPHTGALKLTPYGAALTQLQAGQWSRPARVFAVRGLTADVFDKLAPIQEYGVVRRQPIGGGLAAEYVHNGSDFAAPLGTPVLAMFDGGTVTKTYTDWKESDRGNLEKSRGNYTRVTYSGGTDPTDPYALPNGLRLEVDYYHLSEVAAEVGDRVDAGDELGTVGSTGNSTGPHLHLEARLVAPTEHGRAAQDWVLDPELLIRDGLVAAAQDAGAPLLPDAPVLGGALWALEQIVSPGSAAPSGYGGFVDVVRDGLSNLLRRADDVTNDGLRQVRDFVGADTFDRARSAVIDTTDKALDWAVGPGREAIRELGDQIGLGDELVDILGVLDDAWDAGKADNFSSSRVQFDAGLERVTKTLRERGLEADRIDGFTRGVRNATLESLFKK